ncbi:DNA-binding protein [Devosia sp.]|uniref:DNA-binding protein n=1 Tax=Devosia sp. TaxID=1871048 RepID=UPI003A91943D
MKTSISRDDAFTSSLKLAYTIDQAVEASGIGRTEMFIAMKQGKLRARKLGKRNIILASDLIAFLESLPVREVA